jgi:glycosyltransferase involved in cell wall biosynthesis
MRIVYIITRADEVGGAQVHVRDLATTVRSIGHEATVLAGWPGWLSDQLVERGVPFEVVPALVRPIAPWWDLLAVLQLRSALRRLRPDLVSVHSSKAGCLGRLAAKLAGIPVVFTAHGWAFTEGVPASQRRCYALVERVAATLADQIITVSDYDRALALEERIAPPHKIARIHNGVHDIGADALASRSGGQNPVRIVMIGRFSPQKDQAGLLRALVRISDIDWRLWLIGGGATQAAAVALTRDLMLADRVEFLGERDDARAFLERADVCVLATHWEGLPRSILEAMSAGLPVVASNVGGVSEAVCNGVNGFLVPRADVPALAECLGRLLREPTLRRAMGQASRQSYETKFRFELMFERTVALYQRMCAHVMPARLTKSDCARNRFK